MHPLHQVYLVTGAEDVAYVLGPGAVHFVAAPDRPHPGSRLRSALEKTSLDATRAETQSWLSQRLLGTTFNAAQELPRLALLCFLRSLAGDVGEQRLRHTLDAIDLRHLHAEALELRRLPGDSAPPPRRTSELRVAEESLTEFFLELLEERRLRPEQDLASELCAHIKDNDEALAALLSLTSEGHEPLGAALAFCLHLLGHHPDWQGPCLDSTETRRAVLLEAMRLYPPKCSFSRQALGARKLPGGTEVRPGQKLLLCPYLLHRDPECFPKPEEFRPDRFLGGRPPGSFCPFGGETATGCPGQSVAVQQALLVLGEVLSRYRLRSLSPRQPVLEAGTVLRCPEPLVVQVEPLRR